MYVSHVVFLKFYAAMLKKYDRVTVSFAGILPASDKSKMFYCHPSFDQ